MFYSNIDYDIVYKVEEFGYPKQFIVESLEKYDMNDAATSYFLLAREKGPQSLL